MKEREYRPHLLCRLPTYPKGRVRMRSLIELASLDYLGEVEHPTAIPLGVDVITANGIGRWLFRRFRQARPGH